jgi:hypothetical protein
MRRYRDLDRCPVRRGALVAYDVRLATKITAAVDLRLRMLALSRRQSLNHVLVAVLDQALPPADELASLLSDSETSVPEVA